MDGVQLTLIDSIDSAMEFKRWLGERRDVLTLAHELGHAVHQTLCAPLGTLLADTPLTLAETASTLCEILALRAPLPTLVQNDIDDPLFTMPEMERADSIIAEVYAKAGAPDHYRCTFYPGPHKFDIPMQEEAFHWFDQWLK